MNSLFSRFSVTAVLLASVVTSQSDAASFPRRQIKSKPVAAEQARQLIVHYRNDARFARSAAALAGTAPRLESQLQLRSQQINRYASAMGVRFQPLRQMSTGAWVFRADKAMRVQDLQQISRQLQSNDPQIAYAEPDRIRRPSFVPTDPYFFSDQWDLQDTQIQKGGMNLPKAWDLSFGKDVVVAVVDTGYRPHPDLVANLIPAPGGQGYGYNFISDPDTARITVADGVTSARGPNGIDMGDWVDDFSCYNSDSSWHGTHVAGTIAAAANGKGVVGVAPQAKILPVRVLGKCGGQTSDIIDGVAWAAGLPVEGVPTNTTPAKVINLSLGGMDLCSKTEAAGFMAAKQKGAVVVVAAGNEGRNARLSTPASCPGVIPVASNGIDGSRAFYSNYGGHVTVTAPGGGRSSDQDWILSTLNAGRTKPSDEDYYGYYIGTSMAAPHVAGVAALMLAINPALTPDQVRNILIKTSRQAPANCVGCGAGLVDAAAAVSTAKGN